MRRILAVLALLLAGMAAGWAIGQAAGALNPGGTLCRVFEDGSMICAAGDSADDFSGERGGR